MYSNETTKATELSTKDLPSVDITLHVKYDIVSSLNIIMKIEIQFILVDNENWLLANLYALTSINKRLLKKIAFSLSQ